jgi:segregation and condensation protein A
VETTAYRVKTEAFQGPLDLLLSLIEKRKLLINDISLAQVTDDFIDYARTNNFPMAESAQFILIASTLLLIKSKSLLPVLELTDQEEVDIADLEKRLEEYKRLKELSRHLSRLFGKKVIFAKNYRYFEPIFSPSREITQKNLAEAVKKVLADFPKEEDNPPKATVKKVLSLEEAIENIIKRIKKGIALSFKEFSKMENKKENVIVSFLALLELFKRGVVEIDQEKRFGEIQITDNRPLQ